MKVLVSLISRQTLPIVLFAKQMGPYDRYIFISSKQMEKEGRTEDVIAALLLTQNNIETYQVNADQPYAILNSLKKLKFKPQHEYHINITGGTKMMALAVFTHFQSYDNAKIYYIPAPSDTILNIHPANESPIPLTAKVNLYEYLAAYGVNIYIESKIKELHPAQINKANEIYDHIVTFSYPPESIKRALSPNYQNYDKNFLIGGWFEIWVANYIKQFFKLDEKDISLNMKLSRSDNQADNEFTEYDVVYVKDNHLYLVECKYFPNGKFSKGKIRAEWYKLAGLRLHMGLNARPYLITMNYILKDVRKSLEDSISLFNIRGFADFSILKNQESFNQFLNRI